MPYNPLTSYHGDQYLNQGFNSIAAEIDKARAQQVQQQQFDQRMALERRAQDFSYGAKSEDLAKDYYGLASRGNVNLTRLPTGEGVIANQGTGQFQYLPPAKEQTSGFGIVFDKDGNQIGEAAMPLLDPQGNVIGNKAVVGGKETVIKPQGENIGTAIGKALSGGGASGAPTAPGAPAGGAATPAPQAAPGAMKFNSPDEVKRAVQEGRISREGAVRVLRSQFGMQ